MATGVVLRVEPGTGTMTFDGSGVVSVEESDGAFTISVSRTGGAAGAASVDFGVTGGSATAGGDYAPLSGTLHWSDEEGGAKGFTIDLVDDALAEADETLELALTSATGADLGSVTAFTVTISDDDGDASGDNGGGALDLALAALLLAAWLLAYRRRASRRGRQLARIVADAGASHGAVTVTERRAGVGTCSRSTRDSPREAVDRLRTP